MTLAEMLVTVVRYRRFDVFSTMVLTFIMLGAVTSVLFDDPRLLLLKGSVTGAVFGLILLGSLAAPRPIMFFFGRKFGTDGTPEGAAYWNGLWRHPMFRRSMTLMWGLGLTLVSVVTGALVFVLPVATMVVVDNVAPPAVIVVLAVISTVYGKRVAAAGARRRAERAAAGLPPE